MTILNIATFDHGTDGEDNEDTLPETNSLPAENRPSQKETIVFQLSIFRRELLVSGRVP